MATYKQCELGRRLQEAREAAGLSRENLAARSHLKFHVLGLAWFEDACKEDFSHAASRIKHLERMGESTFLRFVAEFGPSRWEVNWLELIELVKVVPSRASVDDLAAAILIAEKEKLEMRREAALDGLREITTLNLGDPHVREDFIRRANNLEGAFEVKNFELREFSTDAMSLLSEVA